MQEKAREREREIMPFPLAHIFTLKFTLCESVAGKYMHVDWFQHSVSANVNMCFRIKWNEAKTGEKNVDISNVCYIACKVIRINGAQVRMIGADMDSDVKCILPVIKYSNYTERN